jgi:phage repressor protein C with HTH and peptisase S24 domain
VRPAVNLATIRKTGLRSVRCGGIQCIFDRFDDARVRPPPKDVSHRLVRKTLGALESDNRSESLAEARFDVLRVHARDIHMVTTIPEIRSGKTDKPEIRATQAGKAETGLEDRVRDALTKLDRDRDLGWLARQADIPASTLYENLKRGIIAKTDVAMKIADRLGVSLDWLLTGREGDSGRKIGTQIPVAAAGSPSRSDATRRADLVQVPEIDPSFGLGAVFMDEAAAPEMRTFSRGWLRQITTTPPDELYWAAGRGNSMAPTIEDGEPVLIDRRQQSPRDADLIWAFAWGDIGAIKRLRPMPDGSVKILSDNPAVPPESAHGSEIHIFGRVVAVVKNL